MRAVGVRCERVQASEGEAYDEIEEVDDCPANLLGHAGDGVDDDLAGDDEDDVDEPCA